MEVRDDGARPRPLKRARVTKPGSWDDFKDEIHDLYAVQNYSIEDLMAAMAGKGLHASRRTYMKRITEWGFQKKIRRAEKEAMLRIERRRTAAGKRTTFRIRGQEVTAAKLKRAAVGAEEDVDAGDLDQAETPSCISYGSPADATALELEVEEAPPPTGEVPSVHTASWADDPAEHFWKTRSLYKDTQKTAVDPHEPVVLDEMPTYGLELITPLQVAVPCSHERDVISWYDASAAVEGSDAESSDDESEETDPSEISRPMTPPRPFKLRRYLTSTMPSLNYELRQATIDMRLENGGPKEMIEGPPADGSLRPVDESNATDGQQIHPDDEITVHLRLFGDAVEHRVDDDIRNQHFSDVLGVLKAQYDRESATLNLMALVFDDGEVVSEEQVRDKIEALLDYHHRHYGYEAPSTLDACLAGAILILDANRIDAEQNTWAQPHVRGRLDRVHQLMSRILTAHLSPDTVLELLGDAEAKDVTGYQRPDAEGRAKASTMMVDIIDQTMKSTRVLHALELLPRYHRQWAAWHIQERVREKPFLFTR